MEKNFEKAIKGIIKKNRTMSLNKAKPLEKENGILEYFSLIQTTSELGLSKTDPKFYQNALNALNLKPSEALFIDDIESYLKVGRSIDIITLLYDYKDKISTQLTELLSK